MFGGCGIVALDEILGGWGLLLIKWFPHFTPEKKRGNRTIVVHPGPIGSFFWMGDVVRNLSWLGWVTAVELDVVKGWISYRKLVEFRMVDSVKGTIKLVELVGKVWLVWFGMVGRLRVCFTSSLAIWVICMCSWYSGLHSSQMISLSGLVAPVNDKNGDKLKQHNFDNNFDIQFATTCKHAIQYQYGSEAGQAFFSQELCFLFTSFETLRKLVDVLIYGGFLKWGYPQIIHLQMGFSMK